ncbi:MAG TPA: phage tail protein [Bryobacteraceae bacterium]|nr:phage tail protein [Bryobacteraceae bacterium]
MSAATLRAYRFQTQKHWMQCLLHRFDLQSDGSLLPAARLGSYAYYVSGKAGGAAGRSIAVDAYGQPFVPEGASSALGQSPRLIADREWVWSFDPGGTIVRRADPRSFQVDLELDTGLPVRDIAGDGREGIWVLCGDSSLLVLHFDCQGCARQRYPAPFEAAGSVQMASVNRGLGLALLSQDGTRLVFLDSASGQTSQTVNLSQLAAGWKVTQLTSDARSRIALWGLQAGPSGPAGVAFLLDAQGDIVDGPLAGLFDRPRGAAPPRALDSIRIAVYGQIIWFSADTGLWRLDSSDASGPRESDSTLVTPALYSPATGSDRGWLRAEVFLDLDQNAALEVQAATTDESQVKDDVNRIAGDTTLSTSQRQEAIWERLSRSDSAAGQTYTIPGPASATEPIAIPLLVPEDQWLWMRVSVITPPGTAPAPLRELRILYPDLSIANSLPSIFRGEKNDATGTVRALAGVLESTTQRFDELIRGAASFLDALTAPKEWLDYLARWFDLPWDDGLPVDSKRRLLQRTRDLLDGRGTRAGLLALLQSLLGSGVQIEIQDLTVDHAPVRLGGCGQPGGVLPVLLAGVSLRTPTLGEKAVLGRARLCGGGSALAALVPTLRIRLTAPVASQRAWESLLHRVLAQYVPAGVSFTVRWRAAEFAAPDLIDENGIVIEAPVTGALGTDSAIGRTRLGGRRSGQIGDMGFEMGELQ